MVESLTPVVDINILIVTLGLFFVAALMEIGGGYLVWQWIREKKGVVLGLIGGIILFLYGIIPTLQLWKNIRCIWWNIHYFVNCMGDDCR
jgi:small multidrug resistance family-3 protein